MPLSEHEQRVLEQIERGLYAEDPKFAASVRGIDPKSHYRKRIIVGGAALAVGLGLLLAGLFTRLIPMSIAGVLVMFLGLVYAATRMKRLHDLGGRRPAVRGRIRRVRLSRQPRVPQERQGLIERFEERWHRRFEDRG